MKSVTAANAVDSGAGMRREFEDRDDLVTYLREQFPFAVTVDDAVALPRGGRKAAEEVLATIDPIAYAATRNQLNGAVTRLSPYLRHGVVSLAEVRDAALRKGRSAQAAGRLITELGWRDYFQRIYALLGERVWQSQEGLRTGWSAGDYREELPNDIASGTTGLACIAAFSQELRSSGYLHNHARMWLAAYVVHFRRVRWQAGARWFLTHLLDGDPASNNLSWQWVASTFSHKPYIFNRENLEKYTEGRYCRRCPLKGRCVFEGSYEALEQRLFPHQREQMELPAAGPLRADSPAEKPIPLPERPVVWVHGDNLNPYSHALAQSGGAAALWVWDDMLLERARISLKRIVFLYECLLELPVTIRRGEVAAEIVAFATQQAADGVLTAASPSPGFDRQRRRIERSLPVTVVAEAPFAAAPAGLDLRRFSRYWRKVERSALALTPRSAALW